MWLKGVGFSVPFLGFRVKGDLHRLDAQQLGHRLAHLRTERQASWLSIETDTYQRQTVIKDRQLSMETNSYERQAVINRDRHLFETGTYQ